MERLASGPDLNCNAIATVVSRSLSSGRPPMRADNPAIGPQNHSR